MTVSPALRQRRDEIKERKKQAMGRVAAAKEAVRIAEAHSDSGAAEYAKMALEQAHGEESMALALENAYLGQLGDLNDSGLGETCFDNPDVVRQLQSVGALEDAGRQPRARPDPQPRRRDRDDRDRGSWKGKVSAQNTDIGLPSDPSRSRAVSGAHSAAADEVVGARPPADRHDGSRQRSTTPSRAGTWTAWPGTDRRKPPRAAIKPSSDLTLTDAQCVAVTIAHYQKLKRQQLDDVAGLAVGVQARMTYQVLRRLEHEIIAGDGQAENMTGHLEHDRRGERAVRAPPRRSPTWSCSGLTP